MAHPFFVREPMVLAHRGASAYAPDHTLEALRIALEQGADAIEADVHLTRDGHPVLHHSGNLAENTDGSGPIARYSLTELLRLDAGYAWSPDGGRSHPFRGKGQRILPLAEALATFSAARFNLDIKERRAAVPVRRVIDQHGASDRVLLASFYSWRRAPALSGYSGPRSVTLDRMIGLMLGHWLDLDALWNGTIDAFQLPERYWGLRVVTPGLIQRAHDHGIRVHVWTVDHRSEMDRLLEWGVDGIVTKKPDVALRAAEPYRDR